MIEFFVEGTPVGQGRPRFTTRGGFPRAYDPPKSRAWKDRVSLVATLACENGGALAGEIIVCLEFILPRLKTKPKAEAWEVKPDVDNLAKAVLDALTGIVWPDDKQIVSLDVRKHMAVGKETPGVWIIIP
jgi:Holliday junction resolvase RusA-like endonuclease